jgi:peptidoglycan/LPS O-acetylase OafA/YrhL
MKLLAWCFVSIVYGVAAGMPGAVIMVMTNSNDVWTRAITWFLASFAAGALFGWILQKWAKMEKPLRLGMVFLMGLALIVAVPGLVRVTHDYLANALMAATVLPTGVGAFLVARRGPKESGSEVAL